MKRDLFKIQLDKNNEVSLMVNTDIKMQCETLEVVRESFNIIVKALESDETLVLPRCEEDI